jgi:hypothetical protein
MKRGLCLFAIFCLLVPIAHSEVLLSITKTPYEAFTITMDFTQVIGTDGMTLSSVTAVTSTTNVDVSSMIIAASPVPAVVPSTDKVAFRIQGGAVNSTYRVSAKVVDAVNGQQYEGQILLTITAGG